MIRKEDRVRDRLLSGGELLVGAFGHFGLNKDYYTSDLTGKAKRKRKGHNKAVYKSRRLNRKRG